MIKIMYNVIEDELALMMFDFIRYEPDGIVTWLRVKNMTHWVYICDYGEEI